MFSGNIECRRHPGPRDLPVPLESITASLDLMLCTFTQFCEVVGAIKRRDVHILRIRSDCYCAKIEHLQENPLTYTQRIAVLLQAVKNSSVDTIHVKLKHGFLNFCYQMLSTLSGEEWGMKVFSLTGLVDEFVSTDRDCYMMLLEMLRFGHSKTLRTFDLPECLFDMFTDRQQPIMDSYLDVAVCAEKLEYFRIPRIDFTDKHWATITHVIRNHTNLKNLTLECLPQSNELIEDLFDAIRDSYCLFNISIHADNMTVNQIDYFYKSVSTHRTLSFVDITLCVDNDEKENRIAAISQELDRLHSIRAKILVALVSALSVKRLGTRSTFAKYMNLDLVRLLKEYLCEWCNEDCTKGHLLIDDME